MMIYVMYAGSILLSLLIAVFSGLPITPTLGFTRPYLEYFIIGASSTALYIYYIYRYQPHFKVRYMFFGLLAGLISFLIISFIQLNLRTDLMSPLSFFYYHWTEGVAVLCGAVLLPVVLFSHQVKCPNCRKHSFFDQKLMFSTNKNYTFPVNEYLPLSEFEEQYKHLAKAEKSHSLKSLSAFEGTVFHFYKSKCKCCGEQYVCRKKEVNEKSESFTSEEKRK